MSRNAVASSRRIAFTTVASTNVWAGPMKFFRFTTSAWMNGPQLLVRASLVVCAMICPELAMDSV
ncbi:hypothetical protein TorRG33x02_174360 [Trema orientale]|uniref:Uncharacterized protein n=1 Tax=Trema orientale TaxID=63057 RepID=A0A2P5EMI9_TREOI|nr:hypothetical protein TorRG33x02_174360 [Trema orientale]